MTDTEATAAARDRIGDLRDEIGDLREEVDELRSAARLFDEYAYDHDRSIRRVNELYSEMFYLAQATDSRYAARINEIQQEIKAYLDKILQLRDSMGIETPGGNTRGALLVNPTTFEVPWGDVENVLRRPFESITNNQFGVLAFHFSLIDTPQGYERFLNLMATPIEIPSDSHRFMNWHNITPYEVCARKIAAIKTHLDMRISLNLIHQMTLPSGTAFDALGNSNRDLMHKSTILSIAHEIATASQWQNENPPWRRVLNCRGNGPFRIQALRGVPGGVTIDVQHGILTLEGEPPFYNGEIRRLFESDLRGNNPVHIRPALRGYGISDAMLDLAAHNFNVTNNFNLSSHLLAGTGSLAFDALTMAMNLSNAASFGLATTRVLAEIPGAWAQARAVQTSFNQAMSNVTLGLYHQDFRLDGVIVEEDGRQNNGLINWDIFTWPTPHTFEAINALNQATTRYVRQHPHVSIPQITPVWFFGNPLIALGMFQGTVLCICGNADGSCSQTGAQGRACHDARNRFMSDFRSQASANIANRQPLTFEQIQTQITTTQEDNNDEEEDTFPDRGPKAPIPD